MKRARNIINKAVVLGLIVGRVLFSVARNNCYAVVLFIIFDLILYFMFGGMFAFLIVFLFSTVTLYHMEDHLLYHPDLPPHSRHIVSVPSVFGLPYESVNTWTSDGVQLHLLVILQTKSPRDAPTLLYLHGNAGNVGHRLQNAAEFYQNLKCNIVMLEYRGYGLSKGSPSEHGLYLDCRAALDFIASRPDFNHNEIIIFGRSLGGAIGIDVCVDNTYKDKIWCLIIENTFTSIPDMASVLIGGRIIRKLPIICYKNKFTSNIKITALQVPVLFISGLADTLVPPRMMEDLHKLCHSHNKKLAKFPDGTHNETWNCKGYYQTIETFLNEARHLRKAQVLETHTPPVT